ncbi:MAB_1171c family putative transporter [Streptomyces sp. MUSC 14]|uniref:MAB_1171c family putative transporter n=1 Tax=Streptomyces sp. MUSC 14 TaxID=1354889 RepID=UPI002109994A|nr:MAB_1171c family putative transporter [Streptomyces sp. MUSC 14]
MLIFVAATVWRLYLWSRAPHDAPTRSVALTLLSLGLSNAVAMPGGESGLETIAGHDMLRLVQNLLLLLACYFLMCFYLYSTDGQARRRARVEGIVVALATVAIALATVTAPRGALSKASSTVDMTILQVAAFYLVAGLYLMYAIGAAGWWSARYARMSRRPHATGLWMTAIGLGALAVACAVRAAFVAVRWSGGSVPQQLTTWAAALVAVSSVVFVLGITYSGVRARITATRLWLRRRRDHRRLAPLWQLLISVYPENELRPASRTPWDRWRARGVHRRYHRRIVECRDGLVHISPYLVGEEDDTDLLHLEPAQLARQLRRASAAIRQGVPAPARAVPLAVPQGNERESDVDQLIAVAEALRLTA